jgi:alpha-N-acetylglucosamine transferase
MYQRKTTTHHQSQDDAIHHVRQHARMATYFLHTPFVFGEITAQQMWHATQMERFESNEFVQMPQHCRLRNMQSLSDRMR